MDLLSIVVATVATMPTHLHVQRPFCPSLHSDTVANQENDLYCKSCHRKKFGLKGYGYGGGAGTLDFHGADR